MKTALPPRLVRPVLWSSSAIVHLHRVEEPGDCPTAFLTVDGERVSRRSLCGSRPRGGLYIPTSARRVCESCYLPKRRNRYEVIA
jgi:hypothetical protein